MDKYLFGYCTGPQIIEDTFEAAWAAVLAHPGCIGITWEPHENAVHPGKYTGRLGNYLYDSTYSEISWIAHEGCAPPQTPPSPAPGPAGALLALLHPRPSGLGHRSPRLQRGRVVAEQTPAPKL